METCGVSILIPKSMQKFCTLPFLVVDKIISVIFLSFF